MTKPRVIALVSILLSLSCSKKIESTLISRIFNLDSFGILIPDSNNIDSVRNNNSLINTTLDFIGKSGGGTLLLPE
ncbi:MAG: hypothetical protein KDC52_11920, partial [Ignavibacteriae bacterium]|nr:hypothetical protein [Ignavibacteriota bacterium]